MDRTKPVGKVSLSEEVLKASQRYVLRLYVANTLPSSLSAVRNVEALCKEYLKDSCDLKIIDIYKEPRVARQEQIVATPTLVKLQPLPVRRLVGSLSDRAAVLAGLGLRS